MKLLIVNSIRRQLVKKARMTNSVKCFWQIDKNSTHDVSIVNFFPDFVRKIRNR